jgi:hypothetical protein
MRFTKKDDPIKGIGFVALHFAYLEDQLDVLIRVCKGDLFSVPDRVEKWTFREKTKWLRKQLAKWLREQPACFGKYPDSDFDFRREIDRADGLLRACDCAAVERNEILHRPLLGGQKGPRRKQRDGQEMPVDVGSIYDFAEDVDALQGSVMLLATVMGKLVDQLRRARKA